MVSGGQPRADWDAALDLTVLALLGAGLLTALLLMRRDLVQRLGRAPRWWAGSAGLLGIAIGARVLLAPWDVIAAQGVAYSRAFSAWPEWLFGTVLRVLACVGAPYSVDTAQWLNLGLSALTAPATFVCGLIAFRDPRRALVAGALVAIWPQSIIYSTTLWESPSAAGALLIAAAFMLIAAEGPSVRAVVAANLAALPLMVARKEGFALFALLALAVHLPELKSVNAAVRRLGPYAPLTLLGLVDSSARVGSHDFGQESGETMARVVVLGAAIVFFFLRSNAPAAPASFVRRFVSTPLGRAFLLMFPVEFSGSDNSTYPYTRFMCVIAPLAVVAFCEVFERGRPLRRESRGRDVVVLVSVAIFALGLWTRVIPHNDHQEVEFLKKASLIPGESDTVVTALSQDLRPVAEMGIDAKITSLFNRLTRAHVKRRVEIVPLKRFLEAPHAKTPRGGSTYLYVGLDSASQIRTFVLPAVAQVLSRCEWQVVSQASWPNIPLYFTALDDNYTRTFPTSVQALASAGFVHPGNDPVPATVGATLYKAVRCPGE